MTASASRRIQLPADTPCVLLLGLPGSGKTSLVGALGRAVEIQERSLGNRINDLTQQLRRLRDQLYAPGNPIVANYTSVSPLQVQPFKDGKPDPSQQFHVIIVDCDTNDISNVEKSQSHVFHADAVLYVMDSSSNDQQVERECAQLGQFLLKFRKLRGRRTDEPKLPVWLVLTKCDRLANAGDNRAVWLERVEMRKEEIAQKFIDIQKLNPAPAFGTLQFNIATTGTRQPLLTNALAREDEPFGVAEIFRDAMAAARVHREKKVQSALNIKRLVTAAAMVVAAALLFAILTPIFRTMLTPSAALVALSSYRSAEGTPPAGHLTEPVSQRIERLQAILNDSSFKKLKDSDQTFVRDRIAELEEYREFAAKVKSLPNPTEARNLEELTQIGNRLSHEAVIPPKYSNTWPTSDAGRSYERIKTQTRDLITSANTAIQLLDTRRQQLDQIFLCADGIPKWPEWNTKSSAALALEAPPVDPYAASLADVANAHKRWTHSRERLSNFREILHSLGMISATGQTLLVNSDFKIAQAPAMLATFAREHPKSKKWGQADIPDAALPAVQASARAAYAQLLKSARTAIAPIHNSAIEGPESPAKWRSAIETSAGNPALIAWNELARIALQLAGFDADPLGQLVSFIHQDEFAISISSIEVIQNLDGSTGPLIPTGSLILFVQNPQGQVTKKTFKAPDNISSNRLQFAAADSKPLIYRPGNLMWAELGVTDAAKADLQLTWWANGLRSKYYQFDRLNRAPRLHRVEQKADDGRSMTHIRLEFAPSDALPKIPDLLPEESTVR